DLEAAGSLHRSRLRLPDGRVVTRTTSSNQPLPTAPAQAPPVAPRREPPPPIPVETRHRAAADLLAGLRRHAPQLRLSAMDISDLAPAVTAWLDRDVRPATVQHALTSDLPTPLRHPAGLLRTRLTTLLPPPLPAAPEQTAPGTVPLQDCDRCERVFRAPEPGHCRDCREAESHRAA
ncbi:helix-turn-helix domain-containing protein, partial [Streptomyces sp. DT225]